MSLLFSRLALIDDTRSLSAKEYLPSWVTTRQSVPLTPMEMMSASLISCIGFKREVAGTGMNFPKMVSSVLLMIDDDDDDDDDVINET